MNKDDNECDFQDAHKLNKINKTEEVRRFHIHETHVQRALRKAVEKRRITIAYSVLKKNRDPISSEHLYVRIPCNEKS